MYSASDRTTTSPEPLSLDNSFHTKCSVFVWLTTVSETDHGGRFQELAHDDDLAPFDILVERNDIEFPTEDRIEEDWQNVSDIDIHDGLIVTLVTLWPPASSTSAGQKVTATRVPSASTHRPHIEPWIRRHLVRLTKAHPQDYPLPDSCDVYCLKDDSIESFWKTDDLLQDLQGAALGSTVWLSDMETTEKGATHGSHYFQTRMTPYESKGSLVEEKYELSFKSEKTAKFTQPIAPLIPLAYHLMPKYSKTKHLRKTASGRYN